jgi:mannose-1-phosphate guanylyltransferase
METLEKDIGTENFKKTLTTVYGQLKNISIDYGVMEKSEKVYVTKGEFDWNDVGSWGEVYELSEKDEDGNALIGDVYTEKTFNSYVFSPKKFTAVLGLENVIIINTNDSLLVCHRQNSQDVKDIVDYLRMNKKTDLL